MYFGAEHLIGFFTVVPSAQWYSYLGGGEGGGEGEVRGRINYHDQYLVLSTTIGTEALKEHSSRDDRLAHKVNNGTETRSLLHTIRPPYT